MISNRIGQEMHQFITELYPICRSITGNGVRETLSLIQKRIPLATYEVPSGTKVFDWTVPLEWNIQDAYIKNSRQERVVDFRRCNLHVMSYSQSVKKLIPLKELREHLFTIPERPEWVPYRTSYYKENWGFCLSHTQLQGLQDDEYEVCIESSLKPGHLTYGECYLPGTVSEEVLISCHVCHPSLCNDNLSGIAVSTYLVGALQGSPRHYSYRFVFIPGTIGSITWLSQNQSQVGKIKHGLVLTGLGDSGHYTYKRSRQGHALVDRAMEYVLKQSEEEYRIIDFFPYGYDERQYCSPGFNLPVGCFMRTPHGEYAEYHTSADNLEFVKPDSLARSLIHCLSAIKILDQNTTLVNLNPYCEPQLGKRGLYNVVGGQSGGQGFEMAMLWVLNLSDGQHSLLDIVERSGLHFEVIYDAAEALLKHDLVKKAWSETDTPEGVP